MWWSTGMNRGLGRGFGRRPARWGPGLALVALGLPVATVLGRLLWDGRLLLVPALLFLALVAAVALVGGLGPALVAGAAATLTLAYFFARPLESLRVDRGGDRTAILAFAIGSVALAFVLERLNALRLEAEQAVADRDATDALLDSLFDN